MIKEVRTVTLHTVICDGCGADLADENGECDVEYEYLDGEMDAYDWSDIDGVHLCYNCIKFDENDNPIPTAEALKNISKLTTNGETK